MDVQNTIYDEFQSLQNYCTAKKLSVIFKKTNYMEIAAAQLSGDIFIEMNFSSKHLMFIVTIPGMLLI